MKIRCFFCHRTLPGVDLRHFDMSESYVFVPMHHHNCLKTSEPCCDEAATLYRRCRTAQLSRMVS